MSKQQYSNHRKYYPPHHFVLLPLLAVSLVTAIVQSIRDHANRLEWILFSILCFFVLYLALLLRQHYALGNQDRIVRLEFRLRYFELYGTSSKMVEQKLSFSQIAALRFAPDEEFTVLVDRAIREHLSGDEIKKSIQNWRADEMRL